MTRLIRGALIAPAPIFLLLLLMLVRPTLGWSDAWSVAAIALGCSYGFMLVAGLPTHLILRHFGWESWTNYVVGFLAAMAIVVTVLTAIESPSPPPLHDDNSPFAALTLRGGGWMLMLALCSAPTAVMGSMFWYRAVRDDKAHG